MLPGIRPGAVIQRITDSVIGDSHTIHSRQLVAPILIGVREDRAFCLITILKLLLAQNVATGDEGRAR